MNERDNDSRTITLRVQKAKKRDIGKNILRIDPQTMERLNIQTGDVIGVKGKTESAGIAWPSFPEDNGLGIVRFDSRLRKNAGVSIDDLVEIRKVEPETVQKIILKPISTKIRTNPRFENFIKRKLNNYPVTIDDSIFISIGINREIEFKIVYLEPEGFCIIRQESKLRISELDPSEVDFDAFEEIDSEIKSRKSEHLKVPLKHDVQHVKNYFKYIKLNHHPLPEIGFEWVDLSIEFLNKKISAPICIAAITGGSPLSKAINAVLAKAAQQENIILSVGSQRIGLEDPSTIESFEIVRKYAPDIPIIGNIGIGQISNPEFNTKDFHKCIDMIKADAMAIHFNALHELLQPLGDLSYQGFKENFKKIRESTTIPIIAKEVGCGFDKEAISMLDKLGFDCFDVGGAGGTSFAAIEDKRDKEFFNDFTRNPAEIFREWGIPTPVSIIIARDMTQKLIIATGGLRTGIDIAKSICLGADIGGFAYPFLVSAYKDSRSDKILNTLKEIQTLKNELRSSMWLMNIKNIAELKGNKEKRVIVGKLHQWLSQQQ